MSEFDLIDLSITRARPHESRQGLLCYVAFTFGGLRIDGVTLRRTRSGDIALSFPIRRNDHGHAHQLVRPVTTELRDALTQRVIQELRSLEGDDSRGRQRSQGAWS